jgi:hypothetical protein
LEQVQLAMRGCLIHGMADMIVPGSDTVFVSTELSYPWKLLKSPGYNYRFNLKTGFFARWGAVPEDDPYRSPWGPEIADIEISTVCGGVNGKPCPYCYKANTRHGRNMSFGLFKAIIEKINPNNQLTQVAFGLGAAGEENPSLWDMCAWLREQNIVPNGTIADITEETADKIARHFGACAVSNHFLTTGNGLCYDNVKYLTERGMRQVNIHYVLAQETFENTFNILRDIKEDSRLAKLNALVFLSLKPKGRAVKNNFHPLTSAQFTGIIKTALSMNVNFGFDSCAFPNFAGAVQGLPDGKRLLMMAEGCESFGRFSMYINAEGRCFPCSFCEGEEGWGEGVDLLSSDFAKDLWNGKKFENGRKALLFNDGACPVFNLYR